MSTFYSSWYVATTKALCHIDCIINQLRMRQTRTTYFIHGVHSCFITTVSAHMCIMQLYNVIFGLYISFVNSLSVKYSLLEHTSGSTLHNISQSILEIMKTWYSQAKVCYSSGLHLGLNN